MPALPESVRQAWEERDGPVVFATVDQDGKPNAIYATCVSMPDTETIVVANNYFAKTLQNIFAGSKGSILFITKEGKSFQIKGRISYHTEGSIFEEMKRWNPERHPGHGAAVLHVEEAYTGSKKLL